jgi:hypothetical protein
MLWIALIVVVLLIAPFAAPRLATWFRRREAARATEQFKLRREQLEAKFFELASALGKPRDVTWKQCDFQPGVTFARDRQTGLLTAFVSVNVSFEAIAGGDMEDVEHVGLLRDGCAIFHYQHGDWGTGGRVVFNMNPQEALARFEQQYEPLGV